MDGVGELYAVSGEDLQNAIALLKEQPEIIRCKDCKHCYAEGFVNVRNVCEKHYDFGNVDDDWFCADGERRTDEQQT